MPSIDGVEKVLVVQATDAVFAIAPASGTLTDRSGTIAAGGVSQQAAAANTSRRYFRIQNPSTNSESIWYAFGTAAVADSPSVEVAPGGSEEPAFVDTRAINVIAATTGTKFTIQEG